MTTTGAVRRRWPLLVAVVVVNAVVQAGTVLPALTPGGSGLFLLLFLVSFGALVISTALATAALADAAPDRWVRWPSTRLWIAATLAPLVIAGAGLLSVFAVPVALPVAALLVVGAQSAPHHEAKPRMLAVITTTIATLVIAVLCWTVALTLGLFVTGAAGALVTWLCFGAVGIGLIRWWSALLHPIPTRKDVPTATAGP